MSDFWYILSDPTPERLARMLQVGQQSTFPKLLFIANRMKIERLVEKGLLLGQEFGRPDSLHLNGQTQRAALEGVNGTEGETSEEAISDMDGEFLGEKTGRRRRASRSSVIEELKRQSGVFFDDFPVDGEDSEGTEEEAEVVVENGPTKVG